MNEDTGRRKFLGFACAGGCALLASMATRVHGEDAPPKKTYDFDALTYCCFECKQETCPLLKASLANDLEFKKKTAQQWREKYGREFALDEVFCFGCKAEPAKQGQGAKYCTTRACAVAKGIPSCAHCRDLATCEKELWINFPKHREHVLGIQKDVLG